VPCNITRLAGLTTTIIGAVGTGRDADVVGIARGDSESWRELVNAKVVQTASDVNRVRLLVGERTLVGAVVMGDQSLSLPLEKMVAGEVDISSIRPQLLAGGAATAGVISGFWANWRKQHTS
jgi:NAD(P)H-nitrite reductase large subunit